MASFSRQLKFVSALIDSYGRLTAEALLSNNIEYAKSLARSYALAQKFRATRIWYDWKCSSYGVFVRKFSKCCENGFEV